MSLHRLVLIRTGNDAWMQEDRVGGWSDIGLSEEGVREATAAAVALRAAAIDVDEAFTSVLKCSIKSLAVVLEEIDRMWLPTHAHWRLNGRHAGALQGLIRAEAVGRFGPSVVASWERGWNVRPPEIDPRDPRAALSSRAYAGIAAFNLPRGESFRDVAERVQPCWKNGIVPSLRLGARVLIVAPSDSLRALVHNLERFADESDPTSLDIPAGTPLVYELSAGLIPIRRYFVDDDGHQFIPRWKIAA